MEPLANETNELNIPPHAEPNAPQNLQPVKTAENPPDTLRIHFNKKLIQVLERIKFFKKEVDHDRRKFVSDAVKVAAAVVIRDKLPPLELQNEPPPKPDASAATEAEYEVFLPYVTVEKSLAQAPQSDVLRRAVIYRRPIRTDPITGETIDFTDEEVAQFETVIYAYGHREEMRRIKQLRETNGLKDNELYFGADFWEAPAEFANKDKYTSVPDAEEMERFHKVQKTNNGSFIIDFQELQRAINGDHTFVYERTVDGQVVRETINDVNEGIFLHDEEGNRITWLNSPASGGSVSFMPNPQSPAMRKLMGLSIDVLFRGGKNARDGNVIEGAFAYGFNSLYLDDIAVDASCNIRLAGGKGPKELPDRPDNRWYEQYAEAYRVLLRELQSTVLQDVPVSANMLSRNEILMTHLYDFKTYLDESFGVTWGYKQPPLRTYMEIADYARAVKNGKNVVLIYRNDARNGYNPNLNTYAEAVALLIVGDKESGHGDTMLHIKVIDGNDGYAKQTDHMYTQVGKPLGDAVITATDATGVPIEYRREFANAIVVVNTLDYTCSITEKPKTNNNQEVQVQIGTWIPTVTSYDIPGETLEKYKQTVGREIAEQNIENIEEFKKSKPNY